jgi:opacity protein-like surface antigen
MRSIAALLLSLVAFAQPLAAQDIVYEEVIYLDEGESYDTPGGERFVFNQSASAAAWAHRGIAAYGPFRVLDPTHAALIDVTDAASPAAFAALLRDYPGIATLSMVE